MGRRGGIGSNFLTRHNGPKTSLLKTINGRPTRESSRPVVSATTRRQSPATDDEPLSSTDESELSLSLPSPLSLSNGDHSSPLNQKRPVHTRVPKYHGSKSISPQDDPTDNRGATAPSTTENSNSILSTSPHHYTRKPLPPSPSPKRSLDQIQGGADTHLQDDFEFVSSSQTQKKNKRIHTYGSSQGQSTQQSRTFRQKNVKVRKNKGLHEPHQSHFMNPADRHSIDTPEDLGNPFVGRAFKDPSKKLTTQLQASAKGEEEEGEGEGKTGGFKMPRNVPLDILCSSQEDQGPKFKMPQNVPSDILHSSQEGQDSEFKIPTALPLSPAPKFKMPVGLTLEKYDTRDPSSVARGILNGKEDLRKILDDPDTILLNSSSLKPSAETEAANFSDSSPLSSPPDSPSFASSQDAQAGVGCTRDVYAETLTTRCPMCREAVDADFLSSFGDGRRMNVRRQAKFCRAHKQISAKAEWVARGYPDINWDGLQSRIEKYHSELGDVLEGKTPSYFRENLEVNFKAGKNRTLVQSMMSSDFRTLTPGYYGSRGARIMMEAIIAKFSVRIRKLAPKDRLISSSGVSGYIQAVMVPELAVLLVREDMGLDVEAARKVLVDSIDIGDLLNEDDDDDSR